MKRINQLIASLLLAVLPAIALAWNSQGHQEVGAIADKLLVGSNAETMVKQILGGMNLQTVAVWADCAKGVQSQDDRTFIYEGDSVKYPECKPFDSPDEKRRFESYVSRNWKQCGTAHGHEYCHNQYHYTDVSSRRDHYELGYTGTNSHDIVHSINAAIAVLHDQAPDSPYSISDKREALMLLAHFVGDIHQPLHVVAIYLDDNGNIIDPDVAGYKIGNDTDGGNNLVDGKHLLHLEWDAIPVSMNVDGAESAHLLQEASEIPLTSGDPLTWSASWATDTIRVGRKDAFDGLSFKMRPVGSGEQQDSAPHKWDVFGTDADYQHRADDIKFHQLAKAGARLAQLLRTIWPDNQARAQNQLSNQFFNMESATGAGYVAPDQLKNIKLWLPVQPANNSAAQAEDIAEFKATRPLLRTSRGQEAAEDDVFDSALVVERFKDAIGVTLTQNNAPTLMALITKVEANASQLVAPVKLTVGQGGRKRPFVAYPKAASCLSPKDMAGHRDEDLNQYDLAGSGSYPSTHALLGMMMGMLLGETEPDRADAVMKRGLEFGESRIICGFHYYSDVVAGRLAAAALYARLHADESFMRDMVVVRKEIKAARRF